MVRNIRHLFERGEVTEQELRTLHGIVTELSIGRRQRGRAEPEVGEATEVPRAEALEAAPAGCDPGGTSRSG
jgi:hypothetical protein